VELVAIARWREQAQPPEQGFILEEDEGEDEEVVERVRKVRLE
jgi:hypothetical protein